MGAAETGALLDRLRTRTGLPVGDARKPDGAGWQGTPGASAFHTYLVLHPLDNQRLGSNASLGDRRDAPEWSYQLDGVGVQRRAAETALDLAADVLLVPALTLDGVSVVRVTYITGVGVTADETTNPPLYRGVDRYRLER